MKPSKSNKNLAKIQVGLTPAESKRLIAKAVKTMPIIQRALKEGTIIVDRSTTDALILDELIEEELDLSRYASGIVTIEGTCVTTNQLSPRKLVRGKSQKVIQPKGKRMSTVFMELLEDMDEKDVFIKSANALDPEGNVGVLAASPDGGIIGRTQPVIHRRKVNLLIPVGLEKLIPTSIAEASQEANMFEVESATGISCNLVPVEGNVITEIEAIKILTGAKAIPISAGGVSGAEGAITMVIKGTEAQIQATDAIIHKVKGEENIIVPRRACQDCTVHYSQFQESSIRNRPCSGFLD